MFKRAVGPVLNWPKVFIEWENSGQNQRDFCARRGYSYSQFKDARVKHRHSRARRRRKKSLLGPAPKALGSQGGFFAVSIEKELPEKPEETAQTSEQSEIELKLPFGVVLTFRGVTQR